MEQSKRRDAILAIALDGPVVAADSLTSFADIIWTPGVFRGLGHLASEGIFQLAILLQREKEAFYAVEVLQRVLDTLENEGIPVAQVVYDDQLPSIGSPGPGPDAEHSWIIASDPQVVDANGGMQPLPFTGWPDVVAKLSGSTGKLPRSARFERTTKETSIHMELDLDGTGKGSIATGLPFFDHMLHQVARHGRIDLTLQCKGDLEVDEHHTVEDVAIVLGQAVARALGDKRGIGRYGFELLPMDECLAQVALDFSGRAWFVWDVVFTREMVGTFPTELFSHFFKSFSDEAKCNLHMQVSTGNAHHQAEALFKAFGRALRHAVFRYPGNDDLPSTKGVL
ncbi:MAG: imidazoleglycerol-phosphate dehydratase HisB [Spirochaetae bacterium HGW-Spirochaetae-2]|jgi:imidazoleglycerol-phosphate dehydratase/histidinol-phosphatase|nr:MAG: imidazoleglycerol-phosphate dehydratase HisB [Spirochaetae bacterium HGW-Spirochaetae-2]